MIKGHFKSEEAVEKKKKPAKEPLERGFTWLSCKTKEAVKKERNQDVWKENSGINVIVAWIVPE